MVASAMYVESTVISSEPLVLSWKDKVRRKIQGMKSRIMNSKYYPMMKTAGKVLGIATTVAAYYASVYAVAYFTVVLLIAWGAAPVVAVILAIWLTFVYAVAVARVVVSVMMAFVE